MDEQPRDRLRHGPGWTVPTVLLVLVVLLVIAMFRREDAKPPERPPMQPAASTFLDCTDCHGDLDRVFKAGELPTLLFTHEKDKVNVPKMTTCYQCHSTRAGAQAPGNCNLCHPPNLNPEPKSHLAADWVSELHPDAAKENPFDCTSCHEQSFCDSCHGLPLPHPARFNERTHAETFFEDPGLCETCHPRQPLTGRDWCDTCHHPQGADSTTWIDWHPNVVAQRGAETCFQCHATDTCRTCHRQGPENFTDADLQADEALLTGGVTLGVTTTPSTPTPTPSPSA